MKYRIGVDIDGTLVMHEEILERALQKEFGLEFPPGRRLYTPKGLREDIEKNSKYRKAVEKFWKGREMIRVLHEMPQETRAALRKMAQKAIVYILTARKYSVLSSTAAFFHDNFPDIRGILQVPDGKSLHAKLLELDFLIDDQANIASDVLKSTNTCVLLVAHHYNECLKEKIPRFRDFPAVVKFFEERGWNKNADLRI